MPAPLPDELAATLNGVKALFNWLWSDEGRDDAQSFVDYMAGSGTVSLLMLDLYQQQKQSNWPWIMLDDAYVVRTVSSKIEEWLKATERSLPGVWEE